ncbi:hypothetical protein KDL01_09605 [Actinospica durhamensis]|uniref:Acyl-CoA dehydrogenase/oxidase C-terminal domain-containing protein n=1 Tax=Actinospica durhamensis TaxID=1508375 RepID=A0A941ELH5_9ACTN|nr:acyl-CoA dehydrogenase family protein [Actinospica durhamensis]MBR7833521.1 hypothetical protein [Actinospica durhamensis]
MTKTEIRPAIGLGLERLARAEGLAAGLAEALEGLGAEAAPGSVAALPAAAVPADADVAAHPLAARVGICFVRPAVSGIAPPAELTAFGVRLGAVRLGVTRRLLEHTVAHLSGRTIGGEQAVRKQLIQGTLAEAEVTIAVVRHMLRAEPAVAAAVADAHARLTGLDWELAKLLGASGYLATGPAAEAYVSRLTAHCWIPGSGELTWLS